MMTSSKVFILSRDFVPLLVVIGAYSEFLGGVANRMPRRWRDRYTETRNLPRMDHINVVKTQKV